MDTAPDILLLDMDGVIADVSESYRRALELTAEAYGEALDATSVSHLKAAGDANNDWVLIHRWLRQQGLDVDFEDVKGTYEGFLQGTDEREGLWKRESLIPSRSLLGSLEHRHPMGIVTGRTRADARRFVDRFDLGDFFEAMVCMEDAPRKPSPEPVHLLLERMGIERSDAGIWLVGDTPDDMRAAAAAGVTPVGVIAPYEDPESMRPALVEAGAERVLAGLEELSESGA
jgi:HAD superfamily hydrolase (TIGR01548 family)